MWYAKMYFSEKKEVFQFDGYGGQGVPSTCREAGAFQQWTKKQSDDPVFKAYRKEYKKRFAWIKAGRITDEQFYAWSEQAREMKKKCDREVITLEEFKDWLGKP